MPDAELYDLWDKTATSISSDGVNDDQWIVTFGEIIDRLEYDLAPCVESGKLRAVGL